MIILLIGFAAFGLAVLVTQLYRNAGERLGLVAIPGGRRQHAGAIPVTGGIGLFAGFFVTALGLYFSRVHTTPPSA